MHHSELKPDLQTEKGKAHFKLAIAGNPNSGKSSVFNLLTGLNQKIGNFPGVTVDKRSGRLKLEDGKTITLIDFPGTYSLYPNSLDERIVVQTFSDPKDENYPDGILYVADITKIEKHLLLLTQLKDLNLPLVLVLNMADLAERGGLHLDVYQLSLFLQVPIITLSSRSGKGVENLLKAISQIVDNREAINNDIPFVDMDATEKKVARTVQKLFPDLSAYQALLVGHHHDWLPYLTAGEREKISRELAGIGFESLRHQISETMKRYDRFTPAVQQTLRRAGKPGKTPLTEKVDAVLTHPFLGTLIFMILMIFVFQAIYAWAAWPMEMIESGVSALSMIVESVMPSGWFTSLLTEGIFAGLGGIIVFVPQIAILFFLISILEEVGYMARAAFLFDRLMQFFGLNGRSVVALISGGACAIPAIMSTRTIGNWKERLITILVTPLISCSARIPVYAVLIGFVIPSTVVWGIFNLQGLAFMGLYLLGIIAALASAFVFKLILKSQESSFLMLELPEYRTPVLRNVGLTVWEKVRTFVVEAGKVILVISIMLWALASYGPPQEMERAVVQARAQAEAENLSPESKEDLVAGAKIQASYAGQLGKFIEPAIEPLGFDWKIGIALITSFAAREVFIGTMATIYSIGSEEEEFSIRDRMAQEVNPRTGKPVYSFATSLSLLIFYVFALQCMSTLAIVKRETNSWKWPIIQFLFMGVLAYLGSFTVFQIFS